MVCPSRVRQGVETLTVDTPGLDIYLKSFLRRSTAEPLDVEITYRSLCLKIFTILCLGSFDIYRGFHRNLLPFAKTRSYCLTSGWIEWLGVRVIEKNDQFCSPSLGWFDFHNIRFIKHWSLWLRLFGFRHFWIIRDLNNPWWTRIHNPFELTMTFSNLADDLDDDSEAWLTCGVFLDPGDDASALGATNREIH